MFIKLLDSMQEAHKRANEGKSHDESLGRGRRLVKPTDYFSPSEELEREAEKKKKFLKKSKFLAVPILTSV